MPVAHSDYGELAEAVAGAQIPTAEKLRLVRRLREGQLAEQLAEQLRQCVYRLLEDDGRDKAKTARLAKDAVKAFAAVDEFLNEAWRRGLAAG